MSRPAIAMLGNQFGLYHKLIVAPALSRLETEGYGLAYVSGGSLKPSSDWDAGKPVLRNHIYPLARNYDVAGYMIIASTIGGHADSTRLKSFVDQFAHKPLVCIGPVVPGVACVHPDSYSSTVALMEHMTEDVSRQRFVFIRGLLEAPETVQREAAFRDVLKRKGIPIDERLILEASYLGSSGFFAMDSLLKKTHDIDVVVAANDEMAQGVIHALTHHGLTVPTDVIVSGFDDSAAASSTLPPLTTVSYSINEMVDLVIDQLLIQIDAGENRVKVKTPIHVPAHLVVRASTDQSLTAIQRNTSDSAPHAFNAETFSLLLLDNLQTIKTPSGLSAKDVVNDFVSMLVNGKTQGKNYLFDLLTQLHERPKDVYWWRHLHLQICDALKYQSNNGMSSEALGLAASILSKIYLTVRNVESTLHVSTTLYYELAYLIRARFNTVSTMEELKQALAFAAERYPTNGGYLCLYDHSGGYPDEFARVIFAASTGSIDVDQDASFPSREVLPNGYLHSNFEGPLVIEPLCAGTTHLGYLVIDLSGSRDPDLVNMTALADTITSALWRCLTNV